MQKFIIRGCLVLLTGLLASCSLTATTVEPALPSGRLNDSSTLVYRANGQPVVTNNSANLFTVLVAFLGDPRAVVGKLLPDSTLALRSIDGQTTQPAGSLTHLLLLAIPKFKGVGTYSLAAPAATAYSPTTFQLLDTSVSPPIYYPEQTLAAGTQATIEVTSWNPATRQLQGTFTLTVAAPGTTQATSISEGRFDVDVDK